MVRNNTQSTISVCNYYSVVAMCMLQINFCIILFIGAFFYCLHHTTSRILIVWRLEDPYIQTQLTIVECSNKSSLAIFAQISPSSKQLVRADYNDEENGPIRPALEETIFMLLTASKTLCFNLKKKEDEDDENGEIKFCEFIFLWCLALSGVDI